MAESSSGGGGGGAPARSASSARRRARSSATVARYHGVSSASVAVSHTSTVSRGARGGSGRSRAGARAWISPSVMPRPSDGFVHAHASAEGEEPVATGWPSTTVRRWRSTIPPIASTPVSGSPSAQCAWRGQAASDGVQGASWRRPLSARSPDGDVERHRPRVVVAGEGQDRERRHRRERRGAVAGGAPPSRARK